MARIHMTGICVADTRVTSVRIAHVHVTSTRVALYHTSVAHVTMTGANIAVANAHVAVADPSLTHVHVSADVTGVMDAAKRVGYPADGERQHNVGCPEEEGRPI